jgi:TetR/AcrR family transcriptional regulator, fatty acid metabolism regulator protein
MARETAPPEVDREGQIVRSAYRVMARRGSHRLSLQDIADEAGVSKALLLYHFGTKDNLLLAAMRWALQGTSHRIRHSIEGVDDAREAIDALIDAVFVGPEANREFFLFYLDLVEHLARVPAFGELSAMLHEIINGLYAEVITAGKEQGVFAVDDVETVARDMRSLIEGTLLQWIQSPHWERDHADWRDGCRRVLQRLLGA